MTVLCVSHVNKLMLHHWSLKLYTYISRNIYIDKYTSPPFYPGLVNNAYLLQKESLQLAYACLTVDSFSISTFSGSPNSPVMANLGVDFICIPHAGIEPTLLSPWRCGGKRQNCGRSSQCRGMFDGDVLNIRAMTFCIQPHIVLLSTHSVRL